MKLGGIPSNKRYAIPIICAIAVLVFFLYPPSPISAILSSVEIAAYIAVMEGDVNFSGFQSDLLGLLEPVAKSILFILLIAHVDVSITIGAAILAIEVEIPVQIAAAIHCDGHSAHSVAIG